MTQWDLLYILAGGGVVWTAILVFVVRSVRRVELESIVEQGVSKLRRRLIFPIAVALLVGFAFSMYFLPYPSVRALVVGKPTVVVKVAGLQWQWVISRQQLPVNTSIEFDLTSQDVNHDFGIYDPSGRLITQAQVMPGYTNKLIFKFTEPGNYTIRCLEYCGMFHDAMVAKLTIV